MILDVIKRVFRLLTVSMTGAGKPVYPVLKSFDDIYQCRAAIQYVQLKEEIRYSRLRSWLFFNDLTLQILVFFCSFSVTHHTPKNAKLLRFLLLRDFSS